MIAMTINANNVDEAALRERFAIAPLIDTEIDVGGEGWVGLAASASHDLRLNVTAAVIAEKMGYKSVDYVRKNYLAKVEEHLPRDHELRYILEESDWCYDSFYQSFGEGRTNAPLGVFAFDLAMVRARAALQLLGTTARQGFLIESCAITRSLMEQLAYASYVWDKTSDDAVFNVRPQSLIRSLASVSSKAGRAYGYLSEQSHYHPKEHYRFIGDTFGRTVTQRSWRFKIIASAWTFYILNLKAKIFYKSYRNYEQSSAIKNLESSCKSSFERHFEGVDEWWVNVIRELMD